MWGVSSSRSGETVSAVLLHRRYCLYPFRILLRDVPDGRLGPRKHARMSAVASAGLRGLLRCTPCGRAWRLSAGGTASCGSFFCRYPVPVGWRRKDGLCAGKEVRSLRAVVRRETASGVRLSSV